MRQLSSAEVLWEGFRLDHHGLFRLDHGSVASPVALGSRALDLLRLLVERHGELVAKDEIMATVWPGTAIEDNNLTVQISTLRRVLDQARADGSCIQTIPGRGYRFVVPVTRAEVHGNPDTPIVAAGSPRSPPRLSIVVLPFTNLSDDREQQYFADGITDDLTTDLSRIPHMFVIARNTAFTYRDKPVSARQIGCELGVRYVLEGSVRRLGNQVRVNAQLIDAETDAHLWAERFDDNTSDVFALQNQITSRIAIALDTELVTAEVARPAVDPDALDYLLRERSAFSKPPTLSSLAEAVDWIERALALDPRSAETQSLLAYVYAFRVLNQMTHTLAADIASRRGAGRASLCRNAPQPPRAPCQRPSVPRTGPIRRSHSRIRDRDCIRSQRDPCNSRPRPLQTRDRATKGGDRAYGASDPPQSSRSSDRYLVLRDRACASSAITHR
jgi:TolB-like protein